MDHQWWNPLWLGKNGNTATPLHTLVPEYRDEIIVCTAPSKSFNLAGLQNSNIILTNPKYQKRWRDFVINRLSLSTCNSFAITATKAAYNESEDWIDQVNAYIDGNICYASEFLKKELPKAVVSPCEGTYLLWVDVRTYCSDAQLLEQRMLKQSLILDEGYVFGAEGKGFERINMAAPRSLIKQCMQRFVKAVLDTSV